MMMNESIVFANTTTAPVWLEGSLINGNISSSKAVIEDAVFSNDSLITGNWHAFSLGCLTWKSPNHALFQVANGVLLLGLLSPNIKYGVLFLHAAFVISFLLMTVWAWMVVCAPDFFSWNFAFMTINIIQTLVLLYNIKPIKFGEDMERLYLTVFQPMNVSRRLFKKLIDKNFCMESTLCEGDAYAMQGLTKTDRLGLLLSGTMKVFGHRNLLHHIKEMEFIDSPEFESSVTGDEKFQVSVYAASFCHYIYWPRQSLEYLLTKEPFLTTVFSTIMGRDITNKLYALNSRVKDLNPDPGTGSDIPLSSGPLQKGGDLRRTLAILSMSGTLTGGRKGKGQLYGASVIEEQDESDAPYSATEEEVNLLGQQLKIGYNNEEAGSNVSLHSYEGIHFAVKDQSTRYYSIPVTQE